MVKYEGSQQNNILIGNRKKQRNFMDILIFITTGNYWNLWQQYNMEDFQKWKLNNIDHNELVKLVSHTGGMGMGMGRVWVWVWVWGYG